MTTTNDKLRREARIRAEAIRCAATIVNGDTRDMMGLAMLLAQVLGEQVRKRGAEDEDLVSGFEILIPLMMAEALLTMRPETEKEGVL